MSIGETGQRLGQGTGGRGGARLARMRRSTLRALVAISASRHLREGRGVSD